MKAKSVHRERTWEALDFLPIYDVLDGHLDLLKVVQDIELGQVQAIVPVDQAGMLHDD